MPLTLPTAVSSEREVLLSTCRALPGEAKSAEYSMCHCCAGYEMSDNSYMYICLSFMVIYQVYLVGAPILYLHVSVDAVGYSYRYT